MAPGLGSKSGPSWRRQRKVTECLGWGSGPENGPNTLHTWCHSAAGSTSIDTAARHAGSHQVMLETWVHALCQVHQASLAFSGPVFEPARGTILARMLVHILGPDSGPKMGATLITFVRVVPFPGPENGPKTGTKFADCFAASPF